MNKSVLHFAIDSPGYKSDGMAKGFVENGYEYKAVFWQHERFNLGLEGMRKKCVELAKAMKPTIIFSHIQNGEAFDIETWDELQKHGFVINYSFDVRSKEKMQWMYDVAPHIGYTFFGCQEDIVRCLSLGIKNISHIHSSCDMDLYKPKDQKVNHAFDIVFCGNRYDNSNLEFPLAQERQEMILFLQNNYGDKFKAYGLGQEGGMIRPEVEANVYNFSKIAINQNNFYLTNYSSDRLWRIMSSGTFCLTKYFPGIEQIFQKEVHLDWWHDFDEMKALIDFYLSNDEERDSIAAAGCKLVRGNHRWADRISDMERII